MTTSPFAGTFAGESLADRLRRAAAAKMTGPVAVGSAPQIGSGQAPAPTKPPAGYYDPALDAAERAGQRGLGDLTLDTEKQNERASTGYVTGTTRIGEDRDTSLAGLLRNRTRGLEDVETGRGDLRRMAGRSLADILRARTRGGEDFASSTADRERQYRERGAAQAEGAQAAGVAGGGALAAALARRTADQGREQAGAQRGFDRFSEDSGISESRVNEDRDVGLLGLDRAATRIGEDYDTDTGLVNRGAQRALDDTGQEYQYGVDDRADVLSRAGREQVFFGADTGLQRFFQAAQAGYRPPKKKGA